jgi:hypothetical protein
MIGFEYSNLAQEFRFLIDKTNSKSVGTVRIDGK